MSPARYGVAALPRDRLSLDTCRAALATWLDPFSEHLANAGRIHDAYRATDGAASAAEHVLGHAGAT